MSLATSARALLEALAGCDRISWRTPDALSDSQHDLIAEIQETLADVTSVFSRTTDAAKVGAWAAGFQPTLDRLAEEELQLAFGCATAGSRVGFVTVALRGEWRGIEVWDSESEPG